MRRGEQGAAAVDFVLVLVLLVPLFLGILQVGLVLHVRNTLTSAAAEGARYAAVADRGPAAGASLTRAQIRSVLAGRFARDVTARRIRVEGVPVMRVAVVAEVPALGLWGPGVRLRVTGHALEEVPG